MSKVDKYQPIGTYEVRVFGPRLYHSELIGWLYHDFPIPSEGLILYTSYFSEYDIHSRTFNVQVKVINLVSCAMCYWLDKKMEICKYYPFLGINREDITSLKIVAGEKLVLVTGEMLYESI